MLILAIWNNLNKMLINRTHEEPIELCQNKLNSEDFTEISFHRCILDKYNMSKSHFEKCDFRSAQMNAVNFDETFMSETRLIMVKSVNSSYKGAIFDNTTVLKNGFNPIKYGATYKIMNNQWEIK